MQAVQRLQAGSHKSGGKVASLGEVMETLLRLGTQLAQSFAQAVLIFPPLRVCLTRSPESLQEIPI